MNVMFNLFLVFLVVESLEKGHHPLNTLGTEYQYFLQPHAHHFIMWRNPKLDRPALMAAKPWLDNRCSGEGFSERSSVLFELLNVEATIKQFMLVANIPKTRCAQIFFCFSQSKFKMSYSTIACRNLKPFKFIWRPKHNYVITCLKGQAQLNRLVM